MQRVALSKAMSRVPVQFGKNVIKKRTVHTTPALGQKVKAQAEGEEKKGESSPAVQKQEQHGVSTFPRQGSGLMTPFVGGRLGSVFRELEEEMNAMTRAFGMSSPFELATTPDVARTAMPLACDVEDKGDHLAIAADVPGMTAEDIKITISPDDILSISGERKMEKKEEGEGGMYRVERSYGSFMRRFKLPQGVNAEAIEAETKDGVLRLKVPKAPEKEHKVINVKVN